MSRGGNIEGQNVAGGPRAGRTILTGWAVLVMGLLTVTSVVLVMTARATNFGVMRVEPSQAIEVRAVRFEERSDSTIAVYDAGATQPFHLIAPDQSGFIRGTMKALQHFRRVNRADPSTPFELVRWADGRFSLRDTADGREIALEAFGPSNAADFRRVLNAKGAAQ